MTLHVNPLTQLYQCILLCLFIASSASGQDCKGVTKKTHHDLGITMYVAIPKGRLLKASDPNELDIIIARKAVSSSDTVYEVIIYKAITEKPPKENRKGVSLLLEDGSQIEKADQALEVTTMAGHAALKAQYQLNPQEMVQLSEKPLAKVKLITEEYPVYTKMAQSFQRNAMCLLQSL